MSSSKTESWSEQIGRYRSGRQNLILNFRHFIRQEVVIQPTGKKINSGAVA